MTANLKLVWSRMTPSTPRRPSTPRSTTQKREVPERASHWTRFLFGQPFPPRPHL